MQNQTKSKTDSRIHVDHLAVTFLAVGVCKYYQIDIHIMTTDQSKPEAILTHVLTHFSATGMTIVIPTNVVLVKILFIGVKCADASCPQLSSGTTQDVM